MAIILGQQFNEPLSFSNAPVVERDGHSFVEDQALMELSDRVAARWSDLLESLAGQ
jgi:hypothetical protein